MLAQRCLHPDWEKAHIIFPKEISLRELQRLGIALEVMTRVSVVLLDTFHEGFFLAEGVPLHERLGGGVRRSVLSFTREKGAVKKGVRKTVPYSQINAFLHLLNRQFNIEVISAIKKL